MSLQQRSQPTFTPHAATRIVERAIAPEEVHAVLGNPRRNVYRSHPGQRATWRYRHVDHRHLVVVTDGDVIVTAFRHHPESN